MSDSVFFQRCKNAARNALQLVEISLIQLDIINTFSDNSSEMCHGECKLSILKVTIMKMIESRGGKGF